MVSEMIKYKKKLLITGVLFVVSLLIYTNFTVGFMRCLLYKDFELDKIAPKIYVNKSMSDEQRQRLLNIYQKAEQRIEVFFGDRRAKPYLIAGDSDVLIKKYGNQNARTGITHLSFLETYIVIEPSGLNVDVLSHELCHAELIERVGWYKREFEIPIWFDEGLAMLVDKRFPSWEADWELMTAHGKIAPSLDSLDNSEFFFESKNAYINYIVAQKEVNNWYKKSEQKGLLELIDLLNEGQDFKTAFFSYQLSID